SPGPRPVVRYLRVLVQAAADAVADELAHQREARSFGDVLDGPGDVGDVRPRADGLDARRQRRGRDVHQALRLRRRAPDRDGPGGIAEIAVTADAEVEADQIAVSQHAVARRDAVHDLVVHRDADRCRERAAAHDVALEGRLRALLPGELLGERVELAGGDAGAHPA